MEVLTFRWAQDAGEASRHVPYPRNIRLCPLLCLPYWALMKMGQTLRLPIYGFSLFKSGCLRFALADAEARGGATQRAWAGGSHLVPASLGTLRRTTSGICLTIPARIEYQKQGWGVLYCLTLHCYLVCSRTLAHSLKGAPNTSIGRQGF